MNSGTKSLNALFLTATSLFAINTVCAALEGEQVIQGQVNFDRTNPGTTIINASDRSIINYARFDILENETVQFIQPSEQASVLNRVTGSTNPSQILGSLSANGQVLLVNPAGIIFGENAMIDVGALYAAAAQIGNQDYLDGLNNFSNLEGAVENYGIINAETVDLIGENVINNGLINTSIINLIGQYVVNTGEIYAPGGMIGMIIADEIYAGEDGSRLFVNLGPQDNVGNAGIENDGVLDAENGAVYLGAGDMYSLAMRNSGFISAKDITLDAGDNGVVSVDGTLAASDSTEGALGGSIKVLGKGIGFFDGAFIDASGDVGGGTVNIGGLQGEDSTLRNATLTYVAEGATIQANALTAGDGGDIIVWADGLTRFNGFISAHGGVQSGDGGFAEVSGKSALQWLDDATVDLSAVAGTPGELLLNFFGGVSIVDDVTNANINNNDILNFDDLDLTAANADNIISNDAVDNILFGTDISPPTDLTLFEKGGTLGIYSPIGFDESGSGNPPSNITFITQRFQGNSNSRISESVDAKVRPLNEDSWILVALRGESFIDITGSNDSFGDRFAIFANVTGSINAGGGDDYITITTVFNGSIDAGGGDDIFEFRNEGIVNGNVDGGSGFDTLDFSESKLSPVVIPGGNGLIIQYDTEVSGITIPRAVIRDGYKNVNQVLLAPGGIVPPEFRSLEPGLLTRESALDFQLSGEPIDEDLKNELAKLGLYARNSTIDETLQSYRKGHTVLFQEINSDRPRPNDFKFAVGRADKTSLIAILEAYNKLIGSAESTGGSTKIIQNTLEQVFEDYHVHGKNITDSGPRAYIENRQDSELHAQALQYLNGYRDLFTEIEMLGLTAPEIKISKSILLREIQRMNYSSKYLHEAIWANSELEL